MKSFPLFKASVTLILLSVSIAFSQSQWVTAGRGTDRDQCYSVTIDNNGNSYITGWFKSTSIDFGNGVTLPNNGGNYDFFLVKYDSTGTAVLGKYGGGTLTDKGDGVAIDDAGNIIVTGSFYGTATFDGQSLTSPYNLDAFTVKYTPTGTLEWIKQGTSWSQVKGLEVGVDSSGNYIVAGYFGSSSVDTVNFSGTTINSNGNRDLCVVKYNSAGSLLWGVNAGGPESGDEAHGIVIDGSDNIYVTGNFKGTASFGTYNLTSAGDYDMFVAKLNPADGSFAWAVSAGGTGTDKGYDIDIDGNGNLYICGVVDDTASFSGTQVIATGGSGNDIFVAKYDNAGNFVWVETAGGVGTDYGYGIGVDQNGNSTITGYITDQADFGSTALTSYGGKDIFLAQYDAMGNLLKAENFGGTDTDYGYDVKMNNYGNIYSTGYFALDGYFGFDTLSSAGSYDVFLMKTVAGKNYEGIIVINEIMYNPLESGTDTTEFLEFYNTSDVPVDLSGFDITAGVDFTFPQGATIDSNGYLIIAGDSTGFRNYYGFDADFIWTSGALSNSGESIELSDPGGAVVDAVTYDDYTPWPLDPDGSGPSLELMDPLSDNSLPENWQASYVVGGTPGVKNSMPAPLPPVYPPIDVNAFAFGDSAVLTWELTRPSMVVSHNNGLAYSGFYQNLGQAFGVVFDLSGYTNPTIEQLDFLHYGWQTLSGPYYYNLHIFDWANQIEVLSVDSLTAQDAFLAPMWELAINLNSISGVDTVGIFIEPLSGPSNDVYPGILFDTSLPPVAGGQVIIDNILDPWNTINDPADTTAGNFIMDLWINSDNLKDLTVAPIVQNNLQTSAAQNNYNGTSHKIKRALPYGLAKTKPGIHHTNVFESLISFNIYRGADPGSLGLIGTTGTYTNSGFTFVDDAALSDSTYYYGVSAIYDTVVSDTVTVEYYQPLVLSINEARADNDNDYIPDRLGEVVTVKGIVTSPNFGSSTDYFVQDTSAGINVFAFSFGAMLNPGDKVYVTGEIDQYRGKTEIVPVDSFNINVISTGNALPDTELVTIPNVAEDVEGELILIENVHVVNPATWPSPGSDGNVDITDGTDTLTMRIDKDTDLDDNGVPMHNFNVVGICDQFTFSSPADDGYQIKPRFYSDLIQLIDEELYVISTPELSTAVTNEGTIGMLNAKGGSPGFTWSGSGQLLYEGALMISKAPDHVVDAARAVIGGTSNGPLDADYQYLDNVNVVMETADSTVLVTAFDDSRADQAPLADDGPNIPIGVEVNQTTYTYNDSVNSGYVIYKLEVMNTTGTTIDGILVGAYFDWDIGTWNANTGLVEFNSVQIPGVNGGNPFDAEFAYIYDPAVPNIYMGAVPLSQNYFHASRILHQPDEVYATNFSEANKFNYMNERRPSDPYGPGGANQDKGLIFGMGGGTGGAGTVPDSGFSIPAGGTVTVGFAIVGGNNLADFVQNGKAALKKWVKMGNDITVFEFVTGIGDLLSGIPKEFALHQNYPNPFNPSTSIRYDLSKNTDVVLKIYDMLGREVKSLVDERQEAGYKKVVWDGTNNIGDRVSTGVYFYRLTADDFVKSHKMILMK